MMNKEMQMLIIDLSDVSDRESLHARLQEALDFPLWYGGNLDALYDVLTDRSDPACILIIGWQELEAADPAYFERFRRVLRDAEAAESSCRFIFLERDGSVYREGEGNGRKQDTDHNRYTRLL